MSEEAFGISLGGKSWSVPHLPFRAIKAILPALFEIYLAAGGPSMSGESVARSTRRSSIALLKRPGGRSLSSSLSFP